MEKSQFENTTMKESLKRAVLILLFVLGLMYVLLPGPGSVFDFPVIPNSTISQLDGDTWQNKNIVAYFSDFRREDITKFYKDYFGRMFVLPLPYISLNRPPEEAYKYVRDQQESTFLEEYIFPLRESIFVNGYDPKEENDRYPGRERSFIGDHLYYQDTYFNTKTTLRFYTNNPLIRISVYICIWLAFIAIFKLTKKALRETC